MHQIKIISESSTEIISVADAKNYIRIDTTADDTLLGLMIVSARKQAESYISRDIIAKNRTYYVPKTDGEIDLLFGPIDEVNTVTVKGATAEYTTLGLDDLTVVLNAGPAVNLEINYDTTGMSDGLLKQVLLQMVSSLYDNRTDYVQGITVNELPSNFRRILDGYKYMFI